MPGRRSVVDYSLQRRAVLAGLRTGRAGIFEACDASPYLVRAARYHGSQTETPCPVCRQARLTTVSYVFGDGLAHVSGQAKRPAELARMDAMQAEFAVYEVEVCRACGWNHLTCSYLLGSEPGVAAGRGRGRSPGPRQGSRRRVAIE